MIYYVSFITLYQQQPLRDYTLLLHAGHLSMQFQQRAFGRPEMPGHTKPSVHVISASCLYPVA